MKTIQELYFPGLKNNYTDMVGLEFEIEAERNFLVEPFPNFMQHEDGSLRGNAAELVTHPLPVDKALLVMEDLIKTVNKYDPIRGSPRTSLHVHVNVLDRTRLQVLTSATIYWALEDALTLVCGLKDRYNSLFSIRATKGEAIILKLVEALQKEQTGGQDFLQEYRRNNFKYAGLNLIPVEKLGTIEFRSMNGDLNLEMNSAWIKTVCGIARSDVFKTPEEVLSNLFENKDKLRTFTTTFLDPYIISYLDDRHPGWVQKIYDSIWTVYELGYARDWTKFHDPVLPEPNHRVANNRLNDPLNPIPQPVFNQPLFGLVDLEDQVYLDD